MHPTTAGLIELQHIDDESYAQRKQRAELVSNLDRLKRLVEHMLTGLADKRALLAENERWESDKKIELRAAAEQLDYAKQKLVAATRSKEYQAGTRELDNLRKKFQEDTAELERLTAAISDARTAVAEEEGKLAEIQAEVAREETNSEERLQIFDRVIAEVAGRKAKVAQTLPRAALSSYERVLAKRDGKAVVAAVQGSCGGCKMKIPPQIWVKIQLGREVFQCANCQRYLYYTVEASQAAMQ